MNSRVCLIIALVWAVRSIAAEPTGDKVSYDFVRAHQAVGRVLISPDASLLFFEWRRPSVRYSEANGPTRSSDRELTWIYQVRLNPFDEPLASPALMAKGGASYRLGSLSPDQKHLVFYRLNDDGTEELGVVRLEDLQQKIFGRTSDSLLVDRPPVWLTPEELVYATRSNPTGSEQLWIASVSADSLQKYTGKIPAVPPPDLPQSDGMPPDTKMLAVSVDRSVEVLMLSDTNILKLWVKREGGEPEVIFENRRHD